MKNRTGLQAIPHDVQGVEGEKNVAAPRHKVSARKIKKKLKNTETLGGGGEGAVNYSQIFAFRRGNATPGKREGRLYEAGP